MQSDSTKMQSEATVCTVRNLTSSKLLSILRNGFLMENEGFTLRFLYPYNGYDWRVLSAKSAFALCIQWSQKFGSEGFKGNARTKGPGQPPQARESFLEILTVLENGFNFQKFRENSYVRGFRGQSPRFLRKFSQRWQLMVLGVRGSPTISKKPFNNCGQIY